MFDYLSWSIWTTPSVQRQVINLSFPHLLRGNEDHNIHEQVIFFELKLRPRFVFVEDL
jgi:hypothetical protein